MEGTTLGPYRIIETLASDDRGHVYRAHDSRVPCDVLLRVPLAAHVQQPAAREEWLRTARSAAALTHPHIARLHDIGEADAHVYAVMELIEGLPLARAIPAGGMDVLDVYGRGLQLVDALAHAHEMGILHRGLSASSIIATADGGIKVLNFEPGIAAPAYLAPEQVRGEPATAASDVWSLGVLLHQMASGALPFAGATRPELERAILERPPHPLPDNVPTLLRGIVSRCLAKLPRTRFQHAGELRAALIAAKAAYKPKQHPSLAGPTRSSSYAADLVQSTDAPRASTSNEGARWTRGVLLGAITALVVVLVVIAAIVLTSGAQ